MPRSDQELPAWYVARHLWRDRILPLLAEEHPRLRPQAIRGDLHWDNVVAHGSGFAFIDFDKMMLAPPVFDLAKLIATGFFSIGSTGVVRFQRRRAADLLAGYHSIRPLGPAEIAAVEGFAVILNEETARLGHAHNVPTYRDQADAVGTWWQARRRRDPGDPLGLRAATDPREPEDEAHQLTLFPLPVVRADSSGRNPPTTRLHPE